MRSRFRGDPRHDRVATLYICYFGLAEPLVQNQVLRTFVLWWNLAMRCIYSPFEPIRLASEEKKRRREGLLSEGITWRCLRYHKRPSFLSTIYDIAVGQPSPQA